MLQQLKKNIYIGNYGISLPLGYYGLFRKGYKICAVKFIESGERKNILREKEFIKWFYNYSKYEWYYSEKINDKFTIKNIIKKGNGKATWQNIDVPFLRPHGIMFGDCDIKCGDLDMKRGPGVGLEFITGYIFDKSNEELEKEGFEIAPTKWKNIEEVNLKDKRLKWYRCEPYRKVLEIPVDELW